ncbi:MAG: amidase [Burkholderiaceae bacterium]|jgi:amidase
MPQVSREDPIATPCALSHAVSSAATQAARSASEITSLSACELSEAIHARRISCREVMHAYLDQIARINVQVNALVSLVDEERLLGEADERDRQLGAGQSMGWMHGFPHAIKDLLDTAGIRTTRGSPLFRDVVPTSDAIVVERIRAAGAILIGKTNVPEFGLGSHTYNPVFGTTFNAYDQSRTAGGSSGGAAVALALHLVPVADGSDMMGSLRNPAAFNHVLGLRPSLGRVPSGPAPEVFFKQLSTEGPMGRTVGDVALLLSVIAGFDSRAPLSRDQDPARFTATLERSVTGTRVGWLGNLGGRLAMEAGVLDVCEGALARLSDCGCIIEEVLPEFSFDRLWDCWVTLRHWYVAGTHAELYAQPEKRALFKPEAAWEIEEGLKLRGIEVSRAAADRSQWYAVLRTLFERFDFLAIPSAQVFPFEAALHWPKVIAGRTMDTYHRWMEVVIGATLAGLPAMSVPAGFGAAGLPMGIQIIGPPRGDWEVLQLAFALEKAVGGFVRPPALIKPGSSVLA